MRRPRRLVPGARWFVTIRCARAQFRLRPDPDRTNALRFILAKALERAPGIQLAAAVQMGNHAHIVLTDLHGELATFMEYVDGQLARVLNDLDGVRGQVFERRYSAIEIVDDESFADRIVYTITNPVAANLVRSHSDWPGLVAWFGSVDGPIICMRFRDRDFRRATEAAKRLGDPAPRREDFTDRAELRFAPADGIERSAVRAGILRRERELEQKRNRPVLGVPAVLETDTFDAPDHPKRSPMPLCHAATRERWFQYRAHWRAFERAYREASAAFRTGHLAALFPEHAFRPPLPLRLQTRLAAA